MPTEGMQISIGISGSVAPQTCFKRVKDSAVYGASPGECAGQQPRIGVVTINLTET